jgi:hypothetical protein
MTGLREALEKLADERDSVSGHAAGDYHIRPYELRELLAAHPAEPAPVITDEMVEAKAHVMYGFDWEHATSHVQNKYRAMVRASLEAKPAPVASREALDQILEEHEIVWRPGPEDRFPLCWCGWIPDSWESYDEFLEYYRDHRTDAVLAFLRAGEPS